MDYTAQHNMLRAVLRITGFDIKCQAEEYTDTGEVWEHLHDIKDLLVAALHEDYRAEIPGHEAWCRELYGLMPAAAAERSAAE